MKKYLLILLLLLLKSTVLAQLSDSAVIAGIFNNALTHFTSYDNLKYLCKNIGGRICGSETSVKAVQWSQQAFADATADTVYLQETSVRSWKRGINESATLIYGNKKIKLQVCALGGSIGTGKKGIRAKVIEVQNFEALKVLGTDKIKGKIVFFNRPTNPLHYNTYAAYGGAADQRVQGAIQASYYGGVASVSRSLTLASHDYAHTGIMRYYDSIAKIPAFAISTYGADQLSSILKNYPEAELQLISTCVEKPDTISWNVIAEIEGSEHPERIIAVGAHLDAWDNGEGAHDDGVGVVQVIEVIRLLKAIGYQLKNTIRAVQFMDEEMSQRGARTYAETAGKLKEIHIAAIETDRGGFTPFGFSFDACDSVSVSIHKWKPLFEQYGLWQWRKGYSGVDISFLKEQNVPLFALITDSQRYFDYQHAPTDVFENVNHRELQLGAASMAALIYLIDKYGL